MNLLRYIKILSITLGLIAILANALIAGAIIEKFNLYPITTKVSLFLENSGLSILRAKVKESVTTSDEINEIEIFSNYYDLVIEKHIRPSYEDYGGIDILNGKLFYVDKKGLGWVQINNEFVEVLTKPLELNEAAFTELFGAPSAYSFGVKDILIVNNKDNFTNDVFVSAVNFNPNKSCYFISIFLTKINQELKQIDNWLNIFNSSPCLKRHKNKGFAGTSAGGRLGFKDQSLYLSIGDFYFDGVNEEDITSIQNSDYGKIIEISLKTFDAKHFATGLRNPQGMFVSNDGIFETEHAPQGGDELNYIEFNKSSKNYGWPNASFGVDYGKKVWPLDPNNSNFDNDDYVAPIMSWIPSIGISNIIRFSSNEILSRWDGDLLISTLRDKSIYRVKLNNNQPILIEKIELGFRVRDIIQHQDGIYIQETGSRFIWKLKEKD